IRHQISEGMRATPSACGEHTSTGWPGSCGRAHSSKLARPAAPAAPNQHVRFDLDQAALDLGTTDPNERRSRSNTSTRSVDVSHGVLTGVGATFALFDRADEER